jgi:hypothetical protein
MESEQSLDNFNFNSKGVSGDINSTIDVPLEKVY